MVALKTERQVYLWKVTPTIVPNFAPVKTSLDEIFQIIEDAYSAGNAKIYISPDYKPLDPITDATKIDPKNCIYIADIQTNTKLHTKTFLINRGDPNAANPAWINAANLQVRPAKPEKNEMAGWSAHLVISTKSGGAFEHRACYERMSNVSSTLADVLFRTILDAHTTGNPTYTYKVTEKKKEETKSYRLRLKVKRSPSEQILEDIEKGELSSIRLIKSNSKYQGPGSPDIVKKVTEKLEIIPTKVDKKVLEDYIPKLIRWAKSSNYTDIQFNIKDLPGNASASPRIIIDKKDALETLYSRSIRVTGFSQLLDSCYASVNHLIEAKMIQLLNDNGKW